MNRHLYLRAVTSEMFVDRVVENFENHVVQPALIRVADVHARPLSHGLEPLQFIDLGGIIFLAETDAGRVGLTFPIVRIFLFGEAQSSGWHRQRKT